MSDADAAGRRRVLLVQPSFQPPGGGNGVAAWMVQALQDHVDLSLLTLERFDPAPIDRFFGTAIDPRRITIHRVHDRLQRVLKRLPVPLALLRNSLLLRALRRVDGAYDLAITANNEASFTRPGIQYIHYPTNLRPRPDVDLRWYHAGMLLRPYYRLAARIARTSPDGVRRNLTLVNSDWTGRLMTRWYGVPTVTLHPPVAGDPAPPAWEARRNGILCIGRFSPEKELDRVLDIVAAVRRRVPDAHLHLVGTAGTSRYGRRILARARADRDGVTVHENLSRPTLLALMAGQRWGLHGMREEHFGTAIAEMVRAGCVVWVPDGGGQVEIVGRDERLLYRSADEAVAKIVATVGDGALQHDLRAHLARQGARFSAEQFVARFRAIVVDVLGSADRAPRV